MKFSEMPYKRPDPETIIADCKAATEQLKNAKNYEEARAVFLEVEERSKAVETTATLAYIRQSIDTRDEFYSKEKEFWDEFGPELEEYEQAWLEAMLSSPFRKDFENEYGDLLFVNAEIERKTFSPEIIPDMQKENELVREYDDLIASAQIPFEDGVYTLSQLTPFRTDADDARRLAAWKADGKWYEEHQAQLDRIYDELVHLRDGMGKKLGYGGYTRLGYYRMGRNCYTKDDVEKFRAAVQKYLVPVADSIRREQARRLGTAYPLSFADAALGFRSGNPRPAGTPDDILAQGKKFYDELSPETSEFFRTMLDEELLDVLSTEGKQAGGYCTSLEQYERPFIFANFNGTQHDVEVVTHEAGHAFAYWMNRKRIPTEYADPSMEACEVHSMSMEFFGWRNADGFFSMVRGDEGRLCGCGRKGCLETYCSATGVARTARELLSTTKRPSLLRDMKPEDITSLDVSIAAGKGDKLAKEIYEFTGKMLGEACADFATFCSPEAFIFFGGMTKAGDLIMEPIKQAYDKHVMPVYRGKAQFLISGLDGASAAVLGASAVGWEI